MSGRLTKRPCGVLGAAPQCMGSAAAGPSHCTCREPEATSAGLLDDVNARIDAVLERLARAEAIIHEQESRLDVQARAAKADATRIAYLERQVDALLLRQVGR